MVEASLALAGFAGVVTALRGVEALPPLHRMALVNLLATSFGALFLSLSLLVLLAAGVDEPISWKVGSASGLVVTPYFSQRSIRTVVAARRAGAPGTDALLWLVNTPLAAVMLVQAWNLLSPGAFWPVLLLLSALFGVGCLSFVRLLFTSAGR